MTSTPMCPTRSSSHYISINSPSRSETFKFQQNKPIFNFLKILRYQELEVQQANGKVLWKARLPPTFQCLRQHGWGHMLCNLPGNMCDLDDKSPLFSSSQPSNMQVKKCLEPNKVLIEIQNKVWRFQTPSIINIAGASQHLSHPHSHL